MTKITKSAFGEFEGKPVERYTLSEGEMSVSVLTYGGILQSIVLPDKNGEKRDVLLGYDTLDGYLNNGGYLGALIGRFGNRIDKGILKIDGKEYRCGILALEEDCVRLELRFIKEDGVELPAKIYLFQGLPKVDKMELIIQKAVELGAFQIIPVAMKRCVVKLDEK